MVRAGLAIPRKMSKAPLPFARWVPALSVAAASLLAALPIIAHRGWFPDTAFLMLIGWRLLRADAIPAWWAAPLGLINDLFTAIPLGTSVAFWSLSMLLLELADRRTMWRDYWIEWVLAAVLIALQQLLIWKVAAWSGAPLPLNVMAVPVLIAILVFPLVAFVVSRLDRWRLGR